MPNIVLFLAVFAFSVGFCYAQPVQADDGSRLELKPTTNSVVAFESPDTIRIEDGDSFWLGPLRIRLFGIDAVESGQQCAPIGKVSCFEHARTVVGELLTHSGQVKCSVVTQKKGLPRMSKGGRFVAKCAYGGLDDGVNREMIRRGLAFTGEKRRITEYVELERIAISKKMGIHTSVREHPATFRRRGRGKPFDEMEAIAKISDDTLLKEVEVRKPSWGERLSGWLSKIVGSGK